MVTIALLFYSFQAAIETVHLAACSLLIFALELDRCMTDMILLVEQSGQRLQDRRTTAGRKIIDKGMARECIHAAGDTPDMEVMYILYTSDALHIVDQSRQRNIPGDGFHQYIRGFTYNKPGPYGNEYGNTDRKQRISQRPAGQEAENTGYDDTDGSCHITKDMEDRCTHIEAMAFSL